LNDLHRAAGGQSKHRPGYWADSKGSLELVTELSKSSVGIPTLVFNRGGAAPGTYARKELVYAYAMWISPVFSLQVIQAYDHIAMAECMSLVSERKSG